MSKVKCLAILIALMMVVVALTAQTPGWAWALRAGGDQGDQGNAIAIDSQGNQYVTGYFVGTADFGTLSLTSSGQSDIFVAKLDSAGNYLWAVRAGGVSYDYGNGIAVDSAGSAYLTGSFNGTASFGTHSLSANGYYSDIFAAKLDPAGNFLWVVSAGGTSNNDMGSSIAVDSAGLPYLTGNFTGTASFGAFSLSSSGSDDIFAAKLDSLGSFLWAVRGGGTEFDEAFGIAVDLAGSAYLTGYFQGTSSFGTHSLSSSGSNDIFVAKLDSAGNYLWAVSAGGTAPDYCGGVAVDSAGSAYLTGYFNGTASFGTHSLSSSGSNDIFVAKLDSAGNYLWAVSAGGVSTDYGQGIVVDSAGSAYLTGPFHLTASFGTHSLSSSGSDDIFVAKLDPDGNFLWAVRAGGTNHELSSGIAVDSAGSAYLTGYFQGTSSFSSLTFTSSGGDDIFVAKLTSGTPIDDDLAPGANSSCLYGAWPNPLLQGETAMVKTTVAPGETGYLTFFNLRGQTIARHSLLPGTQQTSFSSSGLPSGVYFYQFQVGKHKEVKKLILLK